VGAFPLKDLKCGVWDWGDRFTKARHHVDEVLEYFEGLDHAPEYIMRGLRTRERMLRKRSGSEWTSANQPCYIFFVVIALVVAASFYFPLVLFATPKDGSAEL